MATLDPRKTSKALLKKGFLLADKDHHYYEFWHDNKMVARTHMSHNDQEIDNWLIGQMKRQCHLEKKDFIDLINCPLSKDAYVDKLREAGIIN
jgi:hypothetical protein